MGEDDALFAILLFIVQQIGVLFVTSGILAEIEYGTIKFEFRIQGHKVTHSRPIVEFDIKAETTK